MTNLSRATEGDRGRRRKTDSSKEGEFYFQGLIF